MGSSDCEFAGEPALCSNIPTNQIVSSWGNPPAVKTYLRLYPP